MDQQHIKEPRSNPTSTSLDRFFRYIVLPLVLITGIYGLVRYVLVGS